jgi:hypothetical protein
MAGKRWLFSAIGLALLTSLVAFGALTRSTASASSLFQAGTATLTTTATEPITSTAIITETAITTETPATTETSTATETPTAIATATSTAVPTTTTTPTATPNPLGRPFWSFSAKFVCGEQPAEQSGQPIAGEPAEINIHNPHYLGPIQIRQKALLLVDRGAPVGRAPGTAEPQAFSPLFALPDDGATMMDCNSIWELLNPGTTPPAPLPLMIGYLVIVSPANLDVVDVMTATTATSNLEPAGIALATTAVEGKRVLIPATAFPDRLLPRDAEFTTE